MLKNQELFAFCCKRSRKNTNKYSIIQGESKLYTVFPHSYPQFQSRIHEIQYMGADRPKAFKWEVEN